VGSPFGGLKKTSIGGGNTTNDLINNGGLAADNQHRESKYCSKHRTEKHFERGTDTQSATLRALYCDQSIPLDQPPRTSLTLVLLLSVISDEAHSPHGGQDYATRAREGSEMHGMG
jgi:hypothetical protein